MSRIAPGGLALRPQVVEELVFTCGVHALPETLVAIDCHLSGRRRVVHGGLLEKHLGRARHEAGHEIATDNHEATIDVVARDTFLVEICHAVALDDEFTETREGMDCGDGDGAVGATVLGQQLRDVDIRHTIAIGQEEVGVGGFEDFGGFPDTSRGSRFRSRVDKFDLPAEAFECPGVLLEIVGEDFLEIPEAEDETAAAEGGIPLHDVPQDGVGSDLDHRLGCHLCDVSEARALASAEDHYGRHCFR